MAVVCLRCGCSHDLPRADWRYLQESECPRCGYVGWASTTALTEATRRTFRQRPPERRVHAA